MPERHVITLYDGEATSGSIKSDLKTLLNNGLKKGDILYFYYNGHGVPNPQAGNTPYILPTDMNLDYIGEEPFFALQNLYKMMENSRAGKVLVFLDSCFTGKTDGHSVYKDKAAPRLSPKSINVPKKGKLAIISAGNETQFSSAWPEKGHRLFTWHLLNTLADKASTVNALYQQVEKEVYNTSSQIGGKLSFQNPTLQGNPDIVLR